MRDESIEYRPHVVVGIVFAGVFVLTAAVLIWIGSILGPEDVSAMDGFPRLLFTAIPIRPFSWVCAALFLFLGYLQAQRTFRAEPTLQISDSGLTFADGTSRPWLELDSVEANKEGSLTLIFVDDRASDSMTGKNDGLKARRSSHKKSNRKTLSGFELGTETEAVKTQIEEKWRAATI